MPENRSRPQADASEQRPALPDAELGLAPDFARSLHPANFSLRAPPAQAEPRRSGHERILIRRMQTAAATFWVWVVVGTLVAAVGIPVGNDADAMAALNELTKFASAFDQNKAEQALLSHATAREGVALSKVAQAVGGRSVPKLVADGTAPAIAPYAQIELTTLAQVEAVSAPSATMAIETPRPDSIAAALSWRLSRQIGAERLVLTGVSLTEIECTGADLAREHEVAAMRAGLLQARARTASAEQRQASAEQLYDARRKWKAPYKAVAKANEKRAEARAALEEAQRQLVLAAASYEAAAEQAQRIAGNVTTQGVATSGANGAQPGSDKPAARRAKRRAITDASEGACRVALAQVVDKASGKQFELRVPARVDERSVAVGSIAQADFTVAKRVGVWNSIKDSTPAGALAHLRGRFSWHYRHAEFGGFKLGGMTVLQFAPLVLLAMSLLLIRGCRGVSATYNPFESPVFGQLPMVGFSSRALNLCALIALPVIGCALCAWSLMQIDQLPIVPALSGVAAVLLGTVAYVSLRRLLELREAIMQTHSGRPPSSTTSRAP
jgi:hypothetical protein